MCFLMFLWGESCGQKSANCGASVLGRERPGTRVMCPRAVATSVLMPGSELTGLQVCTHLILTTALQESTGLSSAF